MLQVPNFLYCSALACLATSHRQHRTYTSYTLSYRATILLHQFSPARQKDEFLGGMFWYELSSNLFLLIVPVFCCVLISKFNL